MLLPPFLYIDPNAGLQIIQQGGPFVGFLLAILGALLWPFKFLLKGFFGFFKKRPQVVWALLVLLIVVGAGGSYYFLNKKVWAGGAVQKVIVLGMDGLDPGILEKMMQEGSLPNFKHLKETGSYSRLGTVIPPQSPVAWSTFATGLNPGGHGMYDFLWRHTENYMPDLALAELKNSKFKNRRQGKPIWTITSEAGVPTKVIHCPVTFPPDKVSEGMLAGMGVPDLLGTQGTFSFYSEEESKGKTQGGKRIAVGVENGKIETVLKGPRGEGGKEIEVDMKMDIDPVQKSINVILPKKEFSLKENQWSDWIHVEFPINQFSKVTGMARFYLKSTSPFALYMSPFNFTPENPIHPISYPDDYAKRLKEAIGDFHTLGMPHDTWALNEGVMTEEMFLGQSQTILDEEVRMLKMELPEFKKGLFIFVVETPDRIEHMFWRAVDPKHPLYTPEVAKKYGDVIPNTYRKMDEILGLVMQYVDDKTTLLVLSDHGFKSFRRAVHLNSWLRDNGFLVYKEGSEGKAGKEFFMGVDWQQTRAYAVGLGSIYLNLKGREKFGIVDPGAEANEVKREIASGLMNFKDDEKGERVVRMAFMGDEIFSGEAMAQAPDMIVGFEDGYRASWQTALGAAPRILIEDNARKWSGDHILDNELVPGIFLSNQKIKKPDPSLYDLSPTILALLGLETPENQKGQNLFS